MKKNKKDLIPDTFYGIDEKDEKKMYYKLFEFSSDETEKNYIGYTDYSEDENGNNKTYGASILLEDDEIKLMPLETKQEIRAFELILKDAQKDKKEK
jgi:hypothetical protein